MSPVTDLSAYRNKDTIHALQTLLGQALKGEISGLLFCVKRPGKQHAMGLTGVYADDPARAIGAADRLKHRLNLMTDQSEQSAERCAI